MKASGAFGFDIRFTDERDGKSECQIRSTWHFAARTQFGRRIAHGLYTASLISALLGTRLPGPRRDLYRADAQFPRPPDLRLQGRPPAGARRRSPGESAARGKGQAAERL